MFFHISRFLCYPFERGGYVTLLSVLIMGTVGISITVGLLLRGLDVSRTGFATQQSIQALAFANACIEEGLSQIKRAPSFTGTTNLVFSGGMCIYTITSQGGQNRTLNASGSVGTVTRKIKVTVTGTSPTATLSSWQEVADF